MHNALNELFDDDFSGSCRCLFRSVTCNSLIAESVLHGDEFVAAFRKVIQKSVIVIIIYKR